jgi:FkbM family methyltransferase
MNSIRVVLITLLFIFWIAGVVYMVFRGSTRKQLPFDIPAGVKHVVVDCGTFTRSHFFAWLDRDPTLLLIGIEPQPRHRELHPKHPRFIHLPYAAGSEARESVAFHVWSDTGASLKDLGDIHARGLGADHRTFETIRVPMVRLDDLFEALQLPISVLKTDVQGADLDVLKGAGATLRRLVKSAVAECQDITGESDPRLYYRDGCKTNQLLPYMTALGFAQYKCVLQNPEIAEVNCYFAKEDAELQRALREIRL